MAKATYMYWQKRFNRENPDQDLEEKIQKIQEKNKNYGYRRIFGELRKQGLVVNKKKVQRIMEIERYIKYYNEQRIKEKVNNATEIRKAFPGYEVIYGVFSKSGFTQRMLDIAKESADILLVNEDHLV